MGPLQALVADGHDVGLVVTQPDRRRGRGSQLVPSPVKTAAFELGIPVSELVADVLRVDAELGVVVAFGRLVKPHVLAALPMVNLHFSLLPRWRGAAPVERAILAGDAVTGVCLMALEEGLDTGPVYARAEKAIGAEETAAELRAALGELGTAMLRRALREGLPEPSPQVGEPTYAAKLEPVDHHLEWHRGADELHRVVRLGQAWSTFRDKRFRVLRARMPADVSSVKTLDPGELDSESLVVGTGGGLLQLVQVQAEGKAPQPADAWRNGARLRPGERFV